MSGYPGSPDDRLDWEAAVEAARLFIAEGNDCPHVESWSVWVSGERKSRCAVCHRLLDRSFAGNWRLRASSAARLDIR